MKTKHRSTACNVFVSLIGVTFALWIAPAAHSQNRDLALTWVDRSGEPIRVLGDPGSYRGLDVSPDGTHVAAHRHVDNGGEVWLFDDDGAATLLVADATGIQDNAHPIFSPDGERLVYVSLRDGLFGLYIVSADGQGDEEPIFSIGRQIVPMSWSPDGRHIIYWENTGTEWVLPLEGDRQPFRLMDGPSSHSQISPDGRWVAYNSAGDVWVRAFPDGDQAWQVSVRGGTFPRWRADGGEIYYLSGGFLGMMMAAGIEVVDDAIVVSGPESIFASAYVNLGHTGNYHTYAASPDGQRFLIPRPAPDTLTVIDRDTGETVSAGESFGIGPVFSPDGTRVLSFAADRRFSVTDVASGDRWQVGFVDDPQVFGISAVWSSDGNEIAYLVGTPRGNTVWLTPASGATPPEAVASVPGVGGQLIGWWPDSRSVIYFSGQLGGNDIFRVALDSDAEPIQLARFEGFMNAPRISPDGRLIAYHTGNGNLDEVWVRSLDFLGDEAPDPVRVGEGLGMVSWREDSQELYYVSKDREVMAVAVRSEPSIEIGAATALFATPEFPPAQGNFNGAGDLSLDGRRAVFAVPPEITPPADNEIRVVDRSGQVISRPGEPGRWFGLPRMSTDGARVAVGKVNVEENTGELWVFDLEDGSSRLVVTDRNLGTWMWSPDGSEIAYISFPVDSAEVYRVPADGSGEPELFYRHIVGTGLNLQDWSEDGRFMLFNSGGVLLALPLEGDGEALELVRAEFTVGQAVLSPDSRFLAFSSDEIIPARIWLTTFDADTVTAGLETEKWQLSELPFGPTLSWGQNGREVTFRNEGVIRAVEIVESPEFAIGETRSLFRAPEGAGNIAASRNGERWAVLAPAVE